MHYSYEEAGVVKPNQHVYGVINNLMLRYRFGFPERHFERASEILVPHGSAQARFPPFQENAAKNSTPAISQTSLTFRSRKVKGKCEDFKPRFLMWDFSQNRPGRLLFQ